MSFEQLQQLWGSQDAVPLSFPDHATLLEKVKADSRDFEARIARRDRREIIAGLLLLVFYALPLRHPQGPAWAYWAAIGPVLFVTSCFFLLRFHAARKRREFAHNLTGELAWSIYHTRHQIRLLTQVTWWYLLPLATGSLFRSLYRRGTFLPGDWTLCAVMLLTFSAVYWLNRRAVRMKLQPQLAELTTIRTQWTTLEQDSTASNLSSFNPSNHD